jgi:DNA-binding NtrC family response regulator
VVVADGAESANARIASARTPPALLICDVIMGKTDGLELTRRLLAQIPRLKAIVISAHLAEESWWPADLRACPFLPKPFRNEQLVEAVRAALAG